MAGCADAQMVKDKIVTEQLVNTLPDPVKIYVREHKPTSSNEAGQLADNYVQARGSVADKVERGTGAETRRCHRCGKPGHLMKDCRQREEPQKSQTDYKGENGKRAIECFNCGGKGHYSIRCPHNAMFCAQKGSTTTTRWKSGIVRSGRIEGRELSHILLDTGCSRTLVRHDLVPEDKLLEGEAVTICCAHGDTAVYPLAKVSLEVDGEDMEVEVAVVERLPMEVLLGTDSPQLKELLMKPKIVAEGAMVMTRGATRREKERKAKEERLQEESEVLPNPIVDMVDGTTTSETVV